MKHNYYFICYVGCGILFTTNFDFAVGHGRMIDPPSRASMWRQGFKTPQDFDDTETWCGGLQKQTSLNGKCGICGDPYDQPKPRAHELGGKFGKGIIVREYTKGQTVNIKIDVTANHKGTMEFKICPLEEEGVEATQKCLNKNKLELADGSGNAYQLTNSANQIYTIPVNLPKNLVWAHCVLQWHWKGASNSGHCSDGTSRNGCGAQETYRACADIKINRTKLEKNE